ncbi:hypothetical protein FACS1894199_05040 [Bacteroidia bacterium]|nr:hypothetical protein FACS1894199_05040 [Bacteroidia bacterium]
MYTFHKAERLSHKALFEELFASGKSFVNYPFRVVFKKSSQEGEFPARVGISVSKKKFKSAVKRNRIKRLTRETYRLHKMTFYEKMSAHMDKSVGKSMGKNGTVDILFIYLGTTLPASGLQMEKSLVDALNHIAEDTIKCRNVGAGFARPM